ncbi:MAG: SdrD B-like domain-containing protein [Roseobacter sp.]
MVKSITPSKSVICKTPSLLVSFIVTVFCLCASAAHAQNVDWLLNLDDTLSDPTPAGGTAQYSLEVTNNGFGPADAPVTTLDINVPALTELLSTSGAISGCAPLPVVGPATVTCDVPAIAPNGGVADLTLDLLVTQQGTVSLSASVPTAGDSDAVNNSASETTTVTQGADTTLDVQGPATAASGSLVTYDLVVANNGPDAVSDVVVDFPIPTGLINITPPPGCTLGGSTYTCVIPGPIAVGDSTSIAFGGQISAASSSTVTPVASITGASIPDPDTANGTDSLDTTVTGGSDLAMDKSRSPSGPLLVGDPVVFTLAPSYTGDNPTGLTIIDVVPSNYTIDSVVPASGWDCTISGQQVTCTLVGGSGPGDNVALPTIAINATVAAPGSAINRAGITATGPSDPNPGNNNDSDGGATIEEPTIDLAAVKTGPSPTLVVTGNTYDFEISTRNEGTADFFGTIEMVDSLPAGLDLTGTIENGWNCTPGPVVSGPVLITCTLVYTAGSPLAAGATTPAVTLETLVTQTGNINNSLSVGSPNPNLPDNNPGNDTTSTSVTASAPGASADIAVAKTSSAAPIAGETQTFTFVISNAGPQTATNVTFSDTLTNLVNNVSGGAGNGIVSISAPGATCSSPSAGGRSIALTCTGLTVPICSGAACPTFVVEVTPGGDGGARTNTADVISEDIADPDLTNNESSVGFTVDPRTDMTITKVASPTPVGAGQNLTYVLTAQNENNGLSAADDVEVIDTLPADVTFISASPSAGACSTTPTPNTTTLAGSNNLIECQIGTIANGAQRTVTVVVRPNLATRGISIDNNASVSTTTTETDATNNSAAVTVPVNDPELDLIVNKTESIDPVAIGEDTVYSVLVRNLGPSAAENVVVTDILPPSGISYQSHTIAADGSCPITPNPGDLNGTLTCTFPILPAGEARTITITARGEAKGTVTNQANTSSDETDSGFDTNTANNAQSENTTVRTRADVEVQSKVAVPGTVDLLDDFVFVITVRNDDSIPGTSEADDVVVRDTLPANMQLTGQPTLVVTAGTSTLNSCTGSAGGGSFECNLGTFSAGAVAEITVPVEVTSVTALAQPITNTATIETSSLDVVPGNNTNSGNVTVGSSSLSGNVFRDFDSNDVINGIDSGVGGVQLTLTGTDFDGNTVTRTVTTAADGTYSFDFLPAGTYSITRGTLSEAFLTDGNNTAGSAGGTTGSATQTTGITLPAGTAATGYLFPVIPQARIGVAKAVQSGPTANADGSFNVTFRLLVDNLSLEALQNIVLTDPLAGAAPAFGTFASLGAPATDPLARGQYTMLATPSGTCGGLQAGFNGSGAQTVATGFTLGAGLTCTVDISLRVQPTVPQPAVLPSGGRYENQASVTGEGATSGQTSATNPLLNDLSDSGTNVDPNGNGDPTEAGENDPTPVLPAFTSSVALIKTADTSALSSPPEAGETITYNFEVTNTGDVTLTNITITDPLPGISLSGGPIASLDPGASDIGTITATYVLTQDDVDATEVVNQATASGTDPFDQTVTDPSGTTNGDDTPLTTPLASNPALALVKIDDDSGIGTPTMIGDIILYSFEVTNTGNVTLNNITLTDNLPGVTLSGGPIPSLAPGQIDTTTFTGSYSVVQADLDNGRVENSAVATGTPTAGPPPGSDISGTTISNDTPTVTLINQSAAITLVKSVDDDQFLTTAAVPGDTLTYTFEVTNTGLETLNNITISDPLPGLSITPGPIVSLAPGAVDDTTFVGTYTITPGDIASGQIDNTATVTGNYTDGFGVPQTTTDDDDVTAVLVPIDAVSEVFPAFTGDGGTTTSILASDTVRNQSATLSNVNLTVVSEDPGVTLDPVTGLITLAPGNPAGTYDVTYQICDALNPTICDTAVETVTQGVLPAIEATKTQTVLDNGDGITGVGDTISYTILVENTGNTDLENVALVDTLSTLQGTVVPLGTGPDFVSATNGSTEGDLLVGETATYTATYLLTVTDVTEGGMSNTVTASGLSVIPAGVPGTPATVDDVSDDGIDTDGNTEDDPTELAIAPSLAATGLTLEKTTPLGVVTRGQVVPYTITIRNENPVVGGSFNIVDVLPPGLLYVPDSSTVDGAPFATTVSGRTIVWNGVPVPPFTTVTLTLLGRVTDGAGPGELVNTASVRNPDTGALIPPFATATIRILPEAVFDCGDVIGKVFNDRNRDGYQNAPGTTPPSTDASAERGRLEGEPGLPDVRLVGVDGTTIITDQYGRYHVPCAMLPEDRGSNFILKLDTRTLPSGFRMTTENPRVVRLTPGKMTEMNFGAALTRLVRVDLNMAGFELTQDGKLALRAPLAQGIDGMLRQIADTPMHIRVAFHLDQNATREEERAARKRIKLVERYIRQSWRDIGQVKLTIERTLVRRAQ